MSGITVQQDEETSKITSSSHIEAENQPLRPVSPSSQRDQDQHNSFHTLSTEQVKKLDSFLTQNNLSHHRETFTKASQLIHNINYDTDNNLNLTPHELTSLTNETTHKWRQPFTLYFTILTCSTAAIEQGWAQTAMNGANLYFPQSLGLNNDTGGDSSQHDAVIIGLINAGIYLSVGLFGAWISEPINVAMGGRRGAVLVGSLLCLLGNLGSAFSSSWPVLLMFRMLLGTGLGVNASTVSVFAAECAPAVIRGGLAVSWQMWVAFGIFLGFIANVAVAGYSDELIWRVQLAMPFLPTVPLLVMLWWCPESPAWFVKNGRFDKAFRSLVRLRNAEIQAAKEVYSAWLVHQKTKVHDEAMTTLDLTGTKSNSSSSGSYFRRLLDLFLISRIRHATFAAYTVMLSQQLCGINIIAFFSSTIFYQAGFSTHGALIASCIFGFVNFLGAFPAIWTMDTLGRRSLLLLTLPFMALTMFMAGLLAQYFTLLAILVYVFCALYSPGMGPVPCAYSAEVFPLSHREVGMSFAVASANFWAAVLSSSFPGMLQGLGTRGVFELYAVLNLLAWLLCFVFVRETRLMGLDELDEVFEVGVGRYLKEQIQDTVLYWKKRRGSGHEGKYSRLEQNEEEDAEQDHEERLD